MMGKVVVNEVGLSSCPIEKSDAKNNDIDWIAKCRKFLVIICECLIRAQMSLCI